MDQRSADLLVCEEDLQAYVDGRLDVRRREFIEEYLIRHPDEAARIASYRSQNLAFHDAFDSVAEEPLPPKMEELVAKLAAVRETPDARLGFFRAGAVAAGILLSVTSGWFANEWWEPTQNVETLGAFTQRAFEAHALLSDEMSPPLTEKGAESGHALVQWLTQRTTKPFRSAPDLRQFDLALTGGRVFVRRDLPVAQLIYENAENKLSVYVGMSYDGGDSQSAITFVQKMDLSMFYWKQDNLEFSVVGRMGKEDLLTIANAIHDQLRTQSEMPSPSLPSGTLAPGKKTSPVAISVGEKVPGTPVTPEKKN